MEQLKALLDNITTNKLIKNTLGKGVDESFIEGGKLTWIPWIGNTFINSRKKILIIGESHYYNPTEIGSFEKHQNDIFTQIVVNEIAISRKLNDKRSATMYENFYRSICKLDQKRDEYWHSVAFYNFIQQPMHSRKQRPSKKMIEKAWMSFKAVVEIIKPDFVIFIGVKACDEFNEIAKEIFDTFSLLKIESDLKISQKQVPRSAIVNIKGKEVPIHFIKHSSAYYSGKKWRNYFESKLLIN